MASGRLFAASCHVHCGGKSPAKNITCAQGTGGTRVKKKNQTDSSTRDLTVKTSLAKNTTRFLFVILVPFSPPSSLAPNCLCVSQAYSSCQRMGEGRWEKP